MESFGIVIIFAREILVNKNKREMKQLLEARWMGDMAFEAEVNGHKLVLDVPEEAGGHDLGPRPKPLMLLALAGCTGMDIVVMAKKMRVPLTDFSVAVEGDLTEEHPKHFNGMRIVYRFKGDNLDISKLKKAVQLSMESYCGVSAVYKKAMPVSWDIHVNGVTVE